MTNLYLPIDTFLSSIQLHPIVQQDNNMILAPTNLNYFFKITSTIPNSKAYIVMQLDNKSATQGQLIVRANISASLNPPNIYFKFNPQTQTYQYNGLDFPQQKCVEINYNQLANSSITNFQWKKNGDYYVRMASLSVPITIGKCTQNGKK